MIFDNSSEEMILHSLRKKRIHVGPKKFGIKALLLVVVVVFLY